MLQRLTQREFPSYAYGESGTPHPTRDRAGHSYGQYASSPPAPDPVEWSRSADYLFGIDLFNHGFFWEAHEVWEGLWRASERTGTTAAYLKALIQLAAVGYKARRGSLAGIRAKASRAARLFHNVLLELGSERHRFMGMDVAMLERQAASLADNPDRALCEALGAGIPVLCPTA